MPLRSILLWLFIFLIAYGAYEYWDEQRVRPFEAQLLDTALAGAHGIELRAPGATSPLLLTQTEKGWVASQATAHLPAEPERVARLIDALRAIRSYGVAENSAAARRQDWDPEREWRISVEAGENTTHLRLRNREPRDSLPHVTAYLRLNDRPEWYAVGPVEVAELPADIARLHDLTLSSFPLNFVPRSLRYATADTTVIWENSADQWIDTGTGDASPELEAYVARFAGLSGQHPAMYFDETRPERFSRQSVTILGRRGDSIRIVCWYDTLRPDRHFLQSNQAPRRWVTADSTWMRAHFLPPR